mgnify:CR=1 FL=1
MQDPVVAAIDGEQITCLDPHVGAYGLGREQPAEENHEGESRDHDSAA